jgi:hypothetical protein
MAVAIGTVRAMDASALIELAWLRQVVASGQAREIRIAAGITAPEVARAAGISVSTLWRYDATGPRARTPHGPGALRYAGVLRALAKATTAAVGT